MLIDRQTLCRTGQMQVERMGDEIQHLAVREPPDSNPTLPSRVGRLRKPIRLGVGDIDQAIPY